MPVSPFQRFSTLPAAQGLYDPAAEKDACGLAMVATLRGHAGHDIVEMALNSLRNLEHRELLGLMREPVMGLESSLKYQIASSGR